MVAVCRNTNIIPIPFHDRYGWNTLKVGFAVATNFELDDHREEKTT